LQAKLQLDIVSSCRSDKEIRVALQNLPSGLESTYEDILISTMSQYPKLTSIIKTILEWLVVSFEPLTASQLSEVIAIAPNDESLDFDAIYTDPDDVIEPIAQLVVLDQQAGEMVVQLCHLSLAEYLCSEEISAGPVKEFSINFGEAHAKVSGLCLQYLCMSDFDVELFQIKNALATNKYSLLEYAARNWPLHLDDIPNCSKAEEFDQFVKPRLDWILEPGLKPKNLRNWKYVIVRKDPTMVFDNGSPLLFAIRNDLSQLASIMFRRLPDINQYCFGNGFTCLTVAVVHSALFTVDLLLELGAVVDIPTKDRRLTALHLAAENVDKDMVDFLLDAGASIHSRSKSRSTPFYLAARGGSVEILELLYNRGSELDVKTWDNWTPLMEAIEHDHEPAIELLLKWGADPTNCSTYGTTPLILAHASRFGSIKKLVEDAILRWTTANIVQEELSS
jgi:hypothetical protein